MLCRYGWVFAFACIAQTSKILISTREVFRQFIGPLPTTYMCIIRTFYACVTLFMGKKVSRRAHPRPNDPPAGPCQRGPPRHLQPALLRGLQHPHGPAPPPRPPPVLRRPPRGPLRRRASGRAPAHRAIEPPPLPPLVATAGEGQAVGVVCKKDPNPEQC